MKNQTQKFRGALKDIAERAEGMHFVLVDHRRKTREKDPRYLQSPTYRLSGIVSPQFRKIGKIAREAIGGDK